MLVGVFMLVYVGLWVYGCMGAWVYGCMGVWVHGCMGAWIHASISVYGFVSLRQVCALVVLAHGFVVTRSKIMVTWFYGACG